MIALHPTSPVASVSSLPLTGCNPHAPRHHGDGCVSVSRTGMGSWCVVEHLNPTAQISAPSKAPSASGSPHSGVAINPRHSVISKSPQIRVALQAPGEHKGQQGATCLLHARRNAPAGTPRESVESVRCVLSTGASSSCTGRYRKLAATPETQRQQIAAKIFRGRILPNPCGSRSCAASSGVATPRRSWVTRWRGTVLSAASAHAAHGLAATACPLLTSSSRSGSMTRSASASRNTSRAIAKRHGVSPTGRRCGWDTEHSPRWTDDTSLSARDSQRCTNPNSRRVAELAMLLLRRPLLACPDGQASMGCAVDRPCADTEGRRPAKMGKRSDGLPTLQHRARRHRSGSIPATGSRARQSMESLPVVREDAAKEEAASPLEARERNSKFGAAIGRTLIRCGEVGPLVIVASGRSDAFSSSDRLAIHQPRSIEPHASRGQGRARDRVNGPAVTRLNSERSAA